MAVSAVKKEPAKPKRAESEAAEAPAPVARPRKKKGKWLYAALLLLALGGGGGAWWYLERDAAPGTPRPQPAKPPVFAPLDMFTVNLQIEEGAQFLQVGLTLRLADEAAVGALKQRMPEVRDRILLLLSSKKASQLLTLDGKRGLSAEIQAAVNAILAPATVLSAASSAPSSTAAPAEAPGDARASSQQAQPEPGAEAATAPQESAASEPAQAPAAPAAPAPAQAAPAAPVLPVTGVLFTSFIIQ